MKLPAHAQFVSWLRLAGCEEVEGDEVSPWWAPPFITGVPDGGSAAAVHLEEDPWPWPPRRMCIKLLAGGGFGAEANVPCCWGAHGCPALDARSAERPVHLHGLDQLRTSLGARITVAFIMPLTSIQRLFSVFPHHKTPSKINTTFTSIFLALTSYVVIV